MASSSPPREAPSHETPCSSRGPISTVSTQLRPLPTFTSQYLPPSEQPTLQQRAETLTGKVGQQLSPRVDGHLENLNTREVPCLDDHVAISGFSHQPQDTLQNLSIEHGNGLTPSLPTYLAGSALPPALPHPDHLGSAVPDSRDWSRTASENGIALAADDDMSEDVNDLINDFYCSLDYRKWIPSYRRSEEAAANCPIVVERRPRMRRRNKKKLQRLKAAISGGDNAEGTHVSAT